MEKKGTRVSALRAPPGFEHLTTSQMPGAGDGSAATANEEIRSSITPSPSRGAIHGIFPFPAPRELPEFAIESSSGSGSASASSSDSAPGSANWSVLPEVSSEFSDPEKMEATNAYFFNHHHDQVVALMNRKFQDLLDYDKTKNRKILHVDWIAGNPNDPIKKEAAASAAHGGMSAEERRLSESVARSVMRITHGVSQWDKSAVWNKALFYGDWLTDHRSLRQHFVEIQVKRISGADDELLQKCGISPEYVWLSLHNENAPAVTPIIVPPIFVQPLPSQGPRRELPNPHAPARQPVCRPIPEDEEGPEVEEVEYAAPAATSSLEVPTCSADKGKGKADKPRDQARPAHPDAPIIVSSESVQTPQQRTPLPDMSDLSLGQQDGPAPEDPAAADPSTGPSMPRTGIPRTQPLPATGSFNSLEASQAEQAEQAAQAEYPEHPGSLNESEDDEGTIYLPDGADPFARLAPAHETPILSAADLHRHREEFDRSARAKREELADIYAFLQDPAFVERKNKSFIYTVRVVAVPDRGNVVNDFMGPRIEDRYGTHVAQGGWIVPPLKERIKWRDDHKRAYRNKGAKEGRYEGLPRPQIQNAMPMKFDWTGEVEPRYFGPAAPVWREPCDPCLEDIYWMVWQLLGGKQFLGFRVGGGFGRHRRDPAGDQPILAQCPFKSPSTEALYHAASYPRGKEQ
ncbi:hypothetical protein C8A05DRAFT_37558 [Staphylotrichum tortipilum]|uniref:Uncharacterized protein n=1 Tax=Staphylotrichum tortipilum TaxID=2831512 RepID=A0AAN6MEN0_9PEZI|nr:hypothetical protein C8A05DRAFT_37558 [Staphylotrichum longicolle]